MEWDWPVVTAVAATVTAIATSINAAPRVWKGVCKPLLAWKKKNERYTHLGPCGRDVLKALHDTDTVHISRSYDDTDPPQIHTTLDCVPGAAVACRLVVSRRYEKSLGRLEELGLIEGHEHWRYERSQRNMMPSRLTADGEQYIRKYSDGLHKRERIIRRWFKGLNRHEYKGKFLDEVGTAVRRKLPSKLRASVWLKEYYYEAMSLESKWDKRPAIYEYPSGSREDGVECMVEIPVHGLEVVENDRVFLLIHESNRPRYLDIDPKLVDRFGTYPIQGIVISVVASENPVGTVLNIGHTRVFDLDVENARHESFG